MFKQFTGQSMVLVILSIEFAEDVMRGYED